MAHVNGQWLDWEEQGALINAAAQELVAAGVVRPLDRADGAAVRLWRDMDLCAVLEPAFGDTSDPSALSAEERKAGWQRLHKRFLSPRFEHEAPYWLLHEGQPVGTMTLPQMLRGPNLVSIENLYVLPAHRGRGVSTRALRATHEAIVRAGLGGVRLETYWVWQKALRYYLARRFWLFHWKHDLALMWHHSLPDYRIEIGDGKAGFSIQRAPGGPWEPIFRAMRQGDRLSLVAGPQVDVRDHWIADHGMATFSLALAVAGWPLIRSPKMYQEHHHAESGPPEGLAYRIEWYEALAHRDGWRVETPRIPGLSYRSYAELRGPEAEESGSGDMPARLRPESSGT